MTTVADKAKPDMSRDHDLDWIKGIACIFMLILHAVVMVGLPPTHRLWTVQFTVIHQFYAWFFMASGMNVARAAERDLLKKDWRRTSAVYLLTAVALFVLGIAYSINRRTLGEMELFQGVAACTAVSYIVLRRRWPSWALLVISILLFGVSIDYGYKYYGYLAQPMVDRIIDDTLTWPLWERFLFVHFSLLPWVGWFLIGAVVMRLAGTKSEKWLIALFVAFLVASFYAPWYVPRTRVDFFFRAKIDFLFWSSGVAGLSILAARHWYKSVRPLNQAIEFIGRESFLIFILQWFTADGLGDPLKLIGQATGRDTWMIFPVLQIATVYITYRLTRYFAARRDRTITQPGYLRFWGLLTAIFTFLAGVFYYRRPALSYLLSFPLIVGVGMLFPAVRLVIRNVFGPRKKQPAVAAPATPGGDS